MLPNLAAENKNLTNKNSKLASANMLDVGVYVNVVFIVKSTDKIPSHEIS